MSQDAFNGFLLAIAIVIGAAIVFAWMRPDLWYVSVFLTVFMLVGIIGGAISDWRRR